VGHRTSDGRASTVGGDAYGFDAICCATDGPGGAAAVTHDTFKKMQYG
jgi:hypothetical protein